MANYLDELVADRERTRRGLMALLESETAAIAELQAKIVLYAQTLDERILRLMVYRNLFGPSQNETLNVQTEVEEASKSHTAALMQLQQRERVQRALQETLARVDRGEGIDGATPGQDAKLTVADILGD